MVMQKTVLTFLAALFCSIFSLCADDIYYMPYVDSLRLRQAPSLQSGVIRLLEKYEKLRLIQKGKQEVIDNITGTWLQVRTTNGETGYCFDGYCVFADARDSAEPDYGHDVEKMLPGLWQRDFIITDIPAWEINLTKDGRYWSIYGGEKQKEIRWRYDSGQNMLLLIKDSKITARQTIKRISYGYMVLDFGEEGGSIAFAKWTTELHDAVKCGNFPKVRFLVEHGFDADTLTFNSYSPLHTAAALDGPQAYYKLDIITYLLAKGADVNRETMYMYTPLNEVNGAFKRETTALLLSYGADINHRDNEKQTLLFRRLQDAVSRTRPGACSREDWDFILYLIDQNADITVKNEQDRSLLLPLVLPDPSLLEQAITRAGGPSLKYNPDLLSCAAFLNYKETAELLLDHGADVNGQEFHSGITALHVAAPRGNMEIVRLLIKKGARVNTADAAGDTPLHAMSGRDYQGDHVETIIAILVKAGADVNRKNKRGRAPLHTATVDNGRDVVQALLMNRAAPNLQDDDGNTALHLAVMNVKRYESWRPYAKVIELLLRYGASTTIKNKAGKSVSDIARELRDDDLLRLLKTDKD
jgi:ankyrin repeat protein